jgi:hypothetical protein
MRARLHLALGLLATVAACSASDDDGELRLPLGQTQTARELAFLSVPPLLRMTREEFTASSTKTVTDEPDNRERNRQDTYGRLGYFKRELDTASAVGTASTFYGAFYSHETKAITVIDTATTALLVHELTHALQDQYFDLSRLLATSMSTDEALAKRALIEGDATMAEVRYEGLSRNYSREEVTAVADRYVTASAMREESEKFLDEATVPLVFVALQAFAYTHGSAFVVRQLGIPFQSWSYQPVNALFAGAGPVSTQQILLTHGELDPIVPTGFGTLPAAVSAAYDVVTVDRIGEWYTYLLFRPVSDPVGMQALAAAWDGDQLVMLRKKDGTSSGVVWTSVWDTEDAAREIQVRLKLLHGTSIDEATGSLIAPDGELMRIEQKGNEVCFVKNFDPAMMELLARVALSTKEERRMEILHVVATTPIVH